MIFTPTMEGQPRLPWCLALGESVLPAFISLSITLVIGILVESLWEGPNGPKMVGQAHRFTPARSVRL